MFYYSIVVYRYQCVLLQYSCLPVSVCSIAVQLSTGISVFYYSTVVYRYQCVLLGYPCLQVSMCSVGVQLLISEPTLQAGVAAEESEITYCVTSRLLQVCL